MTAMAPTAAGTAARDGRSIEILLVEDNPGDVVLTRQALAAARIANRLSVVNDGDAAIDFLRRRGEHADVPRPDIVLLDLNLPRRGGLEVLAEIKDDPELRRIPVVVLTTSSADRDVLEAYDRHVNSYVTKPMDIDDFLRVVRTFEDFWFHIVRLPSQT